MPLNAIARFLAANTFKPNPIRDMTHPDTESEPIKTAAFPDGHFYSPVVDREEIQERKSRIWPPKPQVLGIDFNDESHRRILREVFPKYIGDYQYPETLPDTAPPTDYYTGNSQFGWLDSRALFVLMREWRPARIIEVGSGYSSLLMADVNRRFLKNEVSITCIEPYPRDFLTDGIPGLSRVLVQKVQEVPLSEFEALREGDVLFIDSSHVSKTGSDVNYLYFDVLPRLAKGVRIHIHDIFLPHDYPPHWVLQERRSWNEQYVLRALLMDSSAYRVLFGCNYAFSQFPDLVKTALNLPDGAAWGGGSIWIEKTS